MKKIHFDTEKDGFYGAYWKCAAGSDCAMITMLGDDPEDYMARSAVKYLLSLGINVLTMSPAKKDYGHHNYPLERIERAIKWLKKTGNRRLAIAGASTTGTLALTAASYFPELTLTIAMTPSDFIWQGFMQGKKDGMAHRRRIPLFLPRQAAPLHALLLSASQILADHRRRVQAHRRYAQLQKTF